MEISHYEATTWVIRKKPIHFSEPVTQHVANKIYWESTLDFDCEPSRGCTFNVQANLREYPDAMAAFNSERGLARYVA